MESAAREFLFRLLKTPSPSGYEQPIQHLVREYLAGCADTVTTDSHGNVIGAKNAAAATRMLLAGHCDHVPQADPSAHGGGAEGDPEDEGSVDRHRG